MFQSSSGQARQEGGREATTIQLSTGLSRYSSVCPPQAHSSHSHSYVLAALGSTCLSGWDELDNELGIQLHFTIPPVSSLTIMITTNWFDRDSKCMPPLVVQSLQKVNTHPLLPRMVLDKAS